MDRRRFPGDRSSKGSYIPINNCLIRHQGRRQPQEGHYGYDTGRICCCVCSLAHNAAPRTPGQLPNGSRRITAASEAEDEDGMWEPRMEHDLSDSAVSEIQQEGLGAAIKILFLWSHQQLYIAGTKEFQLQSTRVNNRDGDMMSSAMKRRSSVSQHSKGSLHHRTGSNTSPQFSPRSLSRSRMSMRGNETPKSTGAS